MYDVTFVTWLDTELNNRGWTRSQLARAAGISHSALSHIYSGKRNPGSDVCDGIALALKISPDIVYRAAGILPPETEREDLIAQILYDLGGMPITDKEEIREYVRMKRAIAEKRGDYKTGG